MWVKQNYKPSPKSQQIGPINHSQMGDFLLFYPHYSEWIWNFLHSHRIEFWSSPCAGAVSGGKSALTEGCARAGTWDGTCWTLKIQDRVTVGIHKFGCLHFWNISDGWSRQLFGLLQPGRWQDGWSKYILLLGASIQMQESGKTTFWNPTFRWFSTKWVFLKLGYPRICLLKRTDFGWFLPFGSWILSDFVITDWMGL